MVTIIIACGSGIATSTIISDKLDSVLNEHGIDHEFIQCSVPEIDSYVDRADLIVTSLAMDQNYSKPVVNAITYLTGADEDETTDLILSYLNN